MIIKWKCKKCESVQISDSKERHCMDFCKCKESAIDLEEHYMRTMGVPEIIERDEEKESYD